MIIDLQTVVTKTFSWKIGPLLKILVLACMDQFSMELWSGVTFSKVFWSGDQNSMEFWSYSYKTVEEPFTMTQTMTNISPESLICLFVVEVETLLAGDQSRHGSNQKFGGGIKFFSGGPIFHEKIVPPG